MTEPEFTHTDVVGELEITTAYVPSRTGARPARRVTRTAAAQAGPVSPGASTGLPDSPFDETSRRVLSLLHRARARGTRRVSEPALRRAASAAAPELGSTLALLDSLIAKGWLERHENLDRLGNPRNSFLVVTPAGDAVLESLFGPISRDPMADLAHRLEQHLGACRRPEIRDMLQRQLDLIRSGRTPAIDLGDAGIVAFARRQDSSSYMMIIDFFGFLGTRPPGEPLDYKAISGRLFAGEKDSVKHLEALRSKIAAAAESEIGLSLEDLGVTGIHLLYWVPFHGDLRPDGEPVWGSVPALSTRDIRRVRRFVTSATTLVLVENRAALDYLAEISAASRGLLAICTDGMPKRGLYDLLGRVEDLNAMRIITWTDWDLGGLRITENLLVHLSVHRVSVSPVPHPGVPGRRVDVPEGYLSHPDARVKNLAEGIARYGEVYQEESLSLPPAVYEFAESPL